MCSNKPSGLLLSVVSKHNNPLAQKGDNVCYRGVGLGKAVDLQAVGKIDAHALLAPKLFRLEGIEKDFIAVMTCMPCYVQRLPWEPNKKANLLILNGFVETEGILQHFKVGGASLGCEIFWYVIIKHSVAFLCSML